MSRFAVITADADFAHQVRLAAAGLPGSLQSFHAGFLPADIDDVFGQLVGEPVEVLILGPDLRTAEVLAFASAVDVRYPHVSTIFVAQPTPDLTIHAMRSGIRDIVAPAADVDGLRAHIEEAARAATTRMSMFPTGVADQTSRQGRGRVIAVDRKSVV